MAPKSPPLPSLGLVLVRVAAGAILVAAGWPKVAGGVDPSLVSGTQEAFAQAPALFRWWGERVVLPNAPIFAFLIAWGELLAGLGLVFGALTRLSGAVVAFMMLNFYFANTWADGAPFLVILLGVCGVACAISRAGRRWGLDSVLEDTFPTWLTWVKREKTMFG